MRVVVIGIVVVALALAASFVVPEARTTSLTEFSDWLAPHRRAWYALPVVALAFVVLGLALVPVLVLIAVTGVAFGPWLGPVYAMAGCLASASTGFAIGRWAGVGHIERVGGRRVTRVMRSLERNGTLAVFLMRKVPAPFLLANIVAGASRVSYRDFMLGTLLGMCAGVIPLAGFGYQLTNVWQRPSPATIATAVVAVAIPLTLAWAINRALRTPEEPA